MNNYGCLVPEQDRLIGRLAPDPSVLATEVIAHEPSVQIGAHLRSRLVTVASWSCSLWSSPFIRSTIPLVLGV